MQNVLSGMIPRIYNHSYAISADLVVPEGGAEGVIVAEADHLGGFSLFVQDGKLTHTYSMMGVFVYRQAADEPLPAGEVTVRMEFAADAPKPATGGEVTLFINDRPVGKGRMDHTVPVRFSGYAGMDIGRDNGGVVDRGYDDKKPFAFTGTVKKVVFDVKPHLADQDEQELHAAAHHGHVAHALSRMRYCGLEEDFAMKFDDETTDVLIGGYLSKDAAHEDYEAVLAMRRLPARRGGRQQGPRGQPVGRADRPHGPRGRRGPGRGRVRGGSVRTAAAGRDRGRRGDRRRRRKGCSTSKTASKIEEAAGETIPIGGAGLIVAYTHAAAEKVEPAVTRAIKKVVGEAEGSHVKALKAALADAQKKMAEERRPDATWRPVLRKAEYGQRSSGG